MAYEPMTSNQLLSEIESLRLRLAELEASEYALKQTEDALRETRERFLHLIEHTQDSFFVIEEDGRFSDVNERACQSLGYAREELLALSITDLDDGFDAADFKESLEQFAPDVSALQERTFRRKDGTTFSVEVRADLTMIEGKRRLFALARDVTEQERAQEVTERLAQENAVLAEIGRVISSSLNIDEVYPRFAEEVRKLIPSDRIAISLVDFEHDLLKNQYIVGTEVPGRRAGVIMPLGGTITSETIGTQSTVLVQGDDLDHFASRFPDSVPVYEAGMRSFLSVPLISGDEVIGVISIRSHQPNAYTQRDVKLAERIGNQIAGAIANSLLYSELKQTEEANDNLAQENAVLAEIGRVISSSLDIDEVYPRFAEEVGKLLPFDRIVINLVDVEHGMGYPSYIVGTDVSGRRIGAHSPIDGTIMGEAIRKQSSVLIQGDDANDINTRFPRTAPVYEAGLRSFLSVPLISGDAVIGTLNIRSQEANAYTQRDVNLAERIGNQIAGAIANSLLYSELKGVEETRERLAHENAVLAEIGKIISSSVNIDEVYPRFAEEVRKLIPFDRIVIGLADFERGISRVSYALGTEISDRRIGSIVPLEGTATGRVIETRSTLLVQENEVADSTEQSYTTTHRYRAGLRTFLSVPLISGNEAIGVLNLHSTKPNAYIQRDAELAERIGNQIAGSVTNSLLYSELKQADEALQESEQRFRQVAEHIPEVFWLYEFESESIIYVNPAFQDIFLAPPNDLYESRVSWIEAIHPDDKERVLDIFENHGKEELYFEFRLVRPDGSIRWITNRRTPVRNEAGEIYRLVGIAEDITERKLLSKNSLFNPKSLRAWAG